MDSRLLDRGRQHKYLTLICIFVLFLSINGENQNDDQSWFYGRNDRPLLRENVVVSTSDSDIGLPVGEASILVEDESAPRVFDTHYGHTSPDNTWGDWIFGSDDVDLKQNSYSYGVGLAQPANWYDIFKPSYWKKKKHVKPPAVATSIYGNFVLNSDTSYGQAGNPSQGGFGKPYPGYAGAAGGIFPNLANAAGALFPGFTDAGGEVYSSPNILFGDSVTNPVGITDNLIKPMSSFFSSLADPFGYLSGTGSNPDYYTPAGGIPIPDQQTVLGGGSKPTVSTVLAAGSQPLSAPFFEDDGTLINPDGSSIRPDGIYVKPDGSYYRPDGVFVDSDGTETSIFDYISKPMNQLVGNLPNPFTTTDGLNWFDKIPLVGPFSTLDGDSPNAINSADDNLAWYDQIPFLGNFARNSQFLQDQQTESKVLVVSVPDLQKMSSDWRLVSYNILKSMANQARRTQENLDRVGETITSYLEPLGDIPNVLEPIYQIQDIQSIYQPFKDTYNVPNANGGNGNGLSSVNAKPPTFLQSLGNAGADLNAIEQIISNPIFDGLNKLNKLNKLTKLTKRRKSKTLV